MRRPVDPDDVRRRRAAEALVEWAGTSPTRKRSKSSKGAFERAVAEMNEMHATSQWTDAGGRHFVALYAQLHQRIYGAPAAELDGVGYFGAVSSADKMLRDEFAGAPERMVEFIRWAWLRERENEKRRVANGTDGRRLTWRLLYGGRYVLTDYRVAQARRGGRVG